MVVSASAPMTPHGRLYARLEQLWECAGLTTLWVAACVPVITAGSSTLALLRVVAERREGIYRPVVRAFWDELVRAPLARAAATVATLLAAVGVAATLLFGLTATDAATATAVQAAALIAGVALLATIVTMLPLIARGEPGTVSTLWLSVLLWLRRPHTALAGAALTVAVGAGIVLAPPLALAMGWVWARLLIGLSHSAIGSVPIGVVRNER